MQANATDHWLHRGPELWCELHRWALTTDRKDATRWLARFATRIACGDCRRHWETLTKQRPPDTSSNQTLFAWSVALHNLINRRLEKPEMAVEAAEIHWKNRPCRNAPAAATRVARGLSGDRSKSCCGGSTQFPNPKGTHHE